MKWIEWNLNIENDKTQENLLIYDENTWVDYDAQIRQIKEKFKK
jgi:hypothetical protein